MTPVRKAGCTTCLIKAHGNPPGAIQEEYLREIDLPEIERLAEKEWKQYISRLAFKEVKKRFKANVIQAFLMAVNGKSAVEITETLGIAESSVYVYKTRVQRELRAEIIRLNRKLD